MKWTLPITVATPSPSPMDAYVKDNKAATTETHAMLWRSGMNDITIWTSPNRIRFISIWLDDNVTLYSDIY